MSALRNGSMAIEGRVERASAGPPKVTFRTEAGEVLAVAAHATDAGPGGRLASLLGSVRERYRIAYLDRTVVWVEPRDATATAVRREDGTAVGTLLRAATATAVAATGGTLFHFVRDPATPSAPDPARLLILDRSGGEIACLDIEYAADATPDHVALRGSGPRPQPFDRVERDMLLGAGVDMTLGLRAYCPEPR
ncbi:hypothetical protein [Nocardia blacklockiae]|uniref:hypothetical protein n=1 Tax=Nocardia blacklockiae TaxID=480036 RepID=UPI001893A190|nr:hypothetical protein [Nocardia blacklockiae]MBF6173840.1 hypothetical protein [Nocardia blacklockiae]